MYVNLCVLYTSLQIRSIVEDFGLVVISRFGSNPEAFVYEDDTLSTLKVYVRTCRYMYIVSFNENCAYYVPRICSLVSSIW